MMQTLIDRLATLNGRCLNEERLQFTVAELLPEFTREHSFSRSERIDLYHAGSGTGIECKVKGSAMEITAQLLRYEPHVRRLLLITRHIVVIDAAVFQGIEFGHLSLGYRL